MRLGRLSLLPWTLVCCGCWYNPNAAMHAHGLPEIDFRQQEFSPPAPPTSKSQRPQTVVVAAIWTNETTNPVGGLYDYAHYSVTPLFRTYYHPNIAVPIWEGCVDTLKAQGFRAFKDYSDVGNPALVKGPARQAGAVVLRGRLLQALHDQIREDPEQPGYEAVHAQVALEVVDLQGKRLWHDVKTVTFKRPFHPGNDLLDEVGHALGLRLAKDPSFSQSLAAGTPSANAAPHPQEVS